MTGSRPTLREAFARAVSADIGCDPAAEARLAGWLQRGREAWPGVELGEHEPGFVAHVGALVADGSSPLDDAEARHLEDLYLAFACGQGLPAALRSFGAAFRHTLELTHATWRGPAVELDDLVQSVHERLLVGPRPRISTYEGRGSLRAWVKMVALRRLADLGDAQRRGAVQAGGDDVLVSLMMPAKELSTRVVQQRYRGQVQAAIGTALGRLSAAQRILLRQRFVHGLSLAELARLHAVHRVTISKRLARARADVVEVLRDDLSSRLEADTNVDSIARLCLSQLDVSLDALLCSRGVE